MTAALNDDFSAQGLGLTVDDLERFPEDGVRRELIDGLLLVCPAPSRAHQKIASYLERTLEETCPEHLEVVQGVEIRLGPRRTFIPDVLVITADAAQHRSRMYEPHEIALAVEIVSPTSMAIDRVLKPNLYAEAGIPHYWRIEIEDGKNPHINSRFGPRRLLPGDRTARGSTQDRRAVEHRYSGFPADAALFSRSPAGPRPSGRAGPGPRGRG